MRTRCIPSGLRTGGRYARYRRRREQLIEQAKFEAATWALTFGAAVWIGYLLAMAVRHG